jgi:hypothetical protein
MMTTGSPNTSVMAKLLSSYVCSAGGGGWLDTVSTLPTTSVTTTSCPDRISSALVALSDRVIPA